MMGTFILVYLIQSMDKKYINSSKNKKSYVNIFNRFKMPLLAAAIVGLSTEYLFDDQLYTNSSPAFNQDIFTEVPNF